MNDKFRKCLESFPNLIHTSMSQTLYNSLKFFPKIQNLKILELKRNNLKDKELNFLSNYYSNLYYLDLSYNKIEKPSSFQSLSIIPLKILKIKGNPLFNHISKNDVLKAIFVAIPSLKNIDDESNHCINQNKIEIENEEDQEKSILNRKNLKNNNMSIIYID